MFLINLTYLILQCGVVLLLINLNEISFTNTTKYIFMKSAFGAYGHFIMASGHRTRTPCAISHRSPRFLVRCAVAIVKWP